MEEEEVDPKKKKGKEKDKDKKTEQVTEENIEELRKKRNPRLHPEFKKPVLNNVQLDSKNEQAQVLLFRKDYERVIELCIDIIKFNRLSYNTYIIKGHTLYNLNRFPEAEETYIKAIRFKPQEIPFDLEMLVK